MSARRAAFVTLVFAGLGLGLAANRPPEASVRRVAAYPAVLPAGAGRALAERSCLLCHSAMLLTQQAKDSTAWEKTLAQMEKWGAPLSAAEHDTVRTYLLTKFGPRPPGSR